jgi:hypothetical protein
MGFGIYCFENGCVCPFCFAVTDQGPSSYHIPLGVFQHAAVHEQCQIYNYYALDEDHGECALEQTEVIGFVIFFGNEDACDEYHDKRQQTCNDDHASPDDPVVIVPFTIQSISESTLS